WQYHWLGTRGVPGRVVQGGRSTVVAKRGGRFGRRVEIPVTRESVELDLQEGGRCARSVGARRLLPAHPRQRPPNRELSRHRGPHAARDKGLLRGDFVRATRTANILSRAHERFTLASISSPNFPKGCT